MNRCEIEFFGNFLPFETFKIFMTYQKLEPGSDGFLKRVESGRTVANNGDGRENKLRRVKNYEAKDPSLPRSHHFIHSPKTVIFTII